MLQTGAVFHDVTFVDVLVPYASDFEFPSGGWATSVYPVWWGCALGGVGFVVPALTMLVFLESMSRIGVKPVLLLRGAAYMQPAVLAVSMVFLAVIALGDWWASNGPPGAVLAVTALIALAFVGWPVVQTLRWRAFIRHHLELPHSWWIALSMLVILLLAQLVTFLLLNQWIGR